MEPTPPPIPSAEPPPAQSPSRRPGSLFRVLAHFSWLSVPITIAFAMVLFLTRGIPKEMVTIGLFIIAILVLAGGLAGIIALCGIKAYGRKGILWPVIVGFSLWLLFFAVGFLAQFLE